MSALSPPLFSNIGWPLEDYSISNEHNMMNYLYRGTASQTAESFLHIPPSQQQVEFDRSTPSTAISSAEYPVSKMAKKLTHNASERDRRKKINDLYLSLRALLPADKSKKLSIPATISRVLKYIPELQEQVEGLLRKRDELLSRLSSQGDAVHEEKQIKRKSRSSLSAVSICRLSDREVAIQISTYKTKTHKNMLSEILLNLEEDGLQLLNSSSFESFGGRVFYNLHFQVDRTYTLECENLSEKLKSFYA